MKGRPTVAVLTVAVERLATEAAHLDDELLVVLLARIDTTIANGPKLAPDVYPPNKDAVEALRELVAATLTYQRSAVRALWCLASARAKNGGAVAQARASDLADILTPPEKTSPEETP